MSSFSSDTANDPVHAEKARIRCNNKAPGIFLWSLYYGGSGGSRTHVQEYFRKTFSERSRSLLFRSPLADAADVGFRYPVGTPALPGTHAEGPCIDDAGISGCR